MQLSYGYPKGTLGAVKDGYFHRLTESQSIAFLAVQQWAIDNSIDLSILSKYALHPALTLLRYLRANQFDVGKTIDHLKRNCNWRKKFRVDEIFSDEPDSALGCPLSKLTAIFPHWHEGYDLSGRPVLYKQYTTFDAAAIQRIANLDSIIKYHVWEQEACQKLCMDQSLKTGYIVETTTTILDLKDMRIGQVTKDFLSFMKTIAEVDSHQYPETLGNMFIINAPSVFPFVWRMVKVWLDPSVAAKIQVMAGEREWGPVLAECIGEDNLPLDYGGKSISLKTLEHPYVTSLQNMKKEKEQNTAASLASRRSDVTDFIQSSNDEDDCYSCNSFNSVQFLDAKDGEDESLGTHHHFGPKHLHFVTDQEIANGGALQTTFAVLGREEGKSRSIASLLRDPLWLFEYLLHGFSPTQIRKYLGVSLKVHMCLAISTLILSAYTIATTQWISGIARVQMWTGVVMLLVSTAMLTINFAGFLGWWHQNRPLIIMYAGCLGVNAILFLVIGIACFLYATVPKISGYGQDALEEAIPNERSRDHARGLLNDYNMTLGISCVVASVLTFIPMGFACAYFRRIGHNDEYLDKQHQLRTVLKVEQGISIIAALCMLIYGGACLEYLFVIDFEATVFPMFGLVYGGTAVLLSSVVGYWVSETVHAVVIRWYYMFCQPLLISVLLTAASLSLGAIPQSGVVVNTHFSGVLLPNTGDESQLEALTIKIQTQLLVAGILSIFVCGFQFCSMFAAFKLHLGMIQHNLADSNSGKKTTVEASKGYFGISGLLSSAFDAVSHRTLQDRASIIWAIIMGIYNIFFNGTYVILAAHFAVEKNGHNTSWAAVVWRDFSRADDRYIRGDSFLISSCALQAIITGPLLLIYAWATFVRAPFRHVSGITSCLLILTCQVLFYAIEIDGGLKNIHKENTADLIGVFLSGCIFLILFPFLVLMKEILSSSASSSRADTYELIVGLDMEAPSHVENMWGADGCSVASDSTAPTIRRNSITRSMMPAKTSILDCENSKVALNAALSPGKGFSPERSIRSEKNSPPSIQSDNLGVGVDNVLPKMPRSRSSSSVAMVI